MEHREKMAIIGAGPVGLGMAKGLKDHGIPYDQFEADADLGGNWYHGVYSTTHTISARNVTQYSEYPMPAGYPDYPSRNQVLAYLRDYAEHFNLRENIAFNSKIIWAQPHPGETWQITLASGETRVYKGIVLSTGHDWSRRYPDYPGTFTGETIHSKDYKRPDQLAGRRVLVIGAGNSACDIACEAARVGLSSEVSMRRGYWFVPKVLFGKPFHEAFPVSLPIWLHRMLLTAAVKLVVGDYRHYGLPRPDHKILSRVPTVNTELLDYLRHGRVKPRPGIARLDGDKVTFVDGTSGSYDMIVCATGFHLDFPFLPKGLIPVNNDVAPIYSEALLPQHKHLYVVNAFHPIYGFGPLVTAGADLLGRFIKLQDRIELPLGRVIQACGLRPAKTHLVHPTAALRELRWGRRILPWLVPLVEPIIRRRLARQSAAVAEAKRDSLNPEMTVY